MNAPVRIKPDPVANFMPWVGDDERQLRQRILRCQQAGASNAKAAQSDQARTLYWVACDVAAEAAFASAPVEHLKDVLATLARLFMAAGALEAWCVDASAPSGGPSS